MDQSKWIKTDPSLESYFVKIQNSRLYGMQFFYREEILGVFYGMRENLTGMSWISIIFKRPISSRNELFDSSDSNYIKVASYCKYLLGRRSPIFVAWWIGGSDDGGRGKRGWTCARSVQAHHSSIYTSSRHTHMPLAQVELVQVAQGLGTPS